MHFEVKAIGLKMEIDIHPTSGFLDLYVYYSYDTQ